MQKVGDVCESCRHLWEGQIEEPKVLQKAGTTQLKKMQVPFCEHCDGPWVKDNPRS